jgi:plasmid stabilization system protein ParE
MRYRVAFRRRALTQADQAFEWFRQNTVDQAGRFRRDVDQTAAELADFPEAHPILRNDTRRVALTTFKYSLWYRIRGNTVWIVAVIHQSRGPDYLNRRIGKSGS